MLVNDGEGIALGVSIEFEGKPETLPGTFPCDIEAGKSVEFVFGFTKHSKGNRSRNMIITWTEPGGEQGTQYARVSG